MTGRERGFDLPCSNLTRCLGEHLRMTNSETSLCRSLALHIEAALDATETSANKSMSLIYVRQGMLILQQLQDSPVIKRVLSIFEWALDRVLTLAAIEDRQNGNAVREGVEPHESVDQVGAAVGHDFEEMFDQMEPWFGDFLGIDFLDNLRSSGDRGPTCEVVGDNTQ
ncbi:cutinase transcription factor 1 beta [Colletotrichum asianum]